MGAALPDMALPATDGRQVSLAALTGTPALYLYPITSRPDRPLPEGWDGILGARGCKPQSCAFRDRFAELRGLGATRLSEISTQGPGDQAEAAERLRLPYPLLSDAELRLTDALRLPVVEVGGKMLLRRLTLIARDGRIAFVRYPVFPPDADAGAVVDWLAENA